MKVKPNSIWIDCDPGADDALGITLLCKSGIHIAGIVSCYGNGSSVMTADNAAKVLRLAGRTDIPVYSGAEKPLIREFSFSTMYCGEDGLCGSGLEPDTSLLREGDYVSALIDSCEKSGEKVIYLVTGAFTNLSKAMQKTPKLSNYIAEVVTASGCFGLTEFAKRAEWNIAIDPESAKLVYESALPIRAIGLDVTGQLQDDFTEELLKSMKEEPIRDFIQSCTRYNQAHGLNVSSILNDAMAASVLLEPDIADYSSGNVEVDPSARGVDMMRFIRNADGSVRAAHKFDFKRYLALLKELL